MESAISKAARVNDLMLIAQPQKEHIICSITMLGNCDGLGKPLMRKLGASFPDGECEKAAPE